MHASLRCIALASALLLGAVLAGCTTVPTGGVDPGAATRPATTSTPPSPAEPVPDGPRSYADPPATLTNESATEVALAYEEAVVYNALADRGYAEFGVSGGTTTEDATVVEHADGGIYVRVRHPFWVTTDRTDGDRTVQSHADGGTEAVYYVSTDAVVRVAVERDVYAP